MSQREKFKTKFLAVGIFLFGNTMVPPILAQDPSQQNSPPDTYLISPNSRLSVQSEDQVSPSYRPILIQPQNAYSPPARGPELPQIPPIEEVVDQPQHRLDLWGRTRFHRATDARYVSQRVSGFNDASRCCLAQTTDCPQLSFGDSTYSAFSQQIANGSASLMTLYNYDFYPLGTDHQSEVSARGKYQLQKIVDRLRFTSSEIKLQATGDQELDAQRRANIIAMLTDYGISENQVILYHTHSGRSALEMKAQGINFLNSVELRGRTIQSAGSASFSGSATFGQ